MIQNRNIKKLMAEANWFYQHNITRLEPGATILYPGNQSGDNGNLPFPAIAFNNRTPLNWLVAHSAQHKAFQP